MILPRVHALLAPRGPLSFDPRNILLMHNSKSGDLEPSRWERPRRFYSCSLYCLLPTPISPSLPCKEAVGYLLSSLLSPLDDRKASVRCLEQEVGKMGGGFPRCDSDDGAVHHITCLKQLKIQPGKKARRISSLGLHLLHLYDVCIDNNVTRPSEHGNRILIKIYLLTGLRGPARHTQIYCGK